MSNDGTHVSGLACIGDNVVDQYVDQKVYYPGGNALNVAVLARRFGLAEVSYIGLIGNDEEGSHIHSCLLAEGLSDANLRVAVGETGKAKVNIVDGDRVFIGSNKGGIRKRLMLRMDDNDTDVITRLGYVHSSCFSYLESELPRIRSMSRCISFDFSTGRDRQYIASVCQHISLAFFSASDLNDGETIDFINDMHSLGAKEVCVTQGERGAVYSQSGHLFRQGIKHANLVDTMGAGDAFIAGFLTARIKGQALQEGLNYAATCAAEACGWEGAFGHPHPVK